MYGNQNLTTFKMVDSCYIETCFWP